MLGLFTAGSCSAKSAAAGPNSVASAGRDSDPAPSCDSGSVANAESDSDAAESVACADSSYCAATIAFAFVHSATAATPGRAP